MKFEGAVQRLRHVADAANRLAAELPNGVPNLDAARARLAEGVPALAGEPLIDWATLSSNVMALGANIGALAASGEEGAFSDAALAGTWDAIPGIPNRDEVIALVDYATRPALRAGYAAVRDIIAHARWRRGTCPACGALPLLVELRADKEGESRVLRCGRCTAAWSFARLACPACGERDHERLRYLHVDGEVDHRRAECCTSCGFYVKALTCLDPIDDSSLPAIDLELLALDVLALEAGYTRHDANRQNT